MKLIRGDTFRFKFQRKDLDGNVITTAPTQMWFTVKRDYETKTNLIQKTLNNGITLDSAGYYHIVINHEDTCDLYYGSYVCDIQIQNGDDIVTLFKDTITIEEEEVTFEGGI